MIRWWPDGIGGRLRSPQVCRGRSPRYAGRLFEVRRQSVPPRKGGARLRGAAAIATGLFLAAVGQARPGLGAASEAAAVVGRLHEVLLDVLRQAEALGYEGRHARLAPAIEEAFDLRLMGEKVIGRQWKVLGEEERKRWLGTFAELTKANYAARFNRYSGQTFQTLGEEPGQNETVLVRTKLLNPDGDDTDLIYRLYQNDRRWRIIDIYLKGTVSELALRRSEYSSVLKREGFEALVSSVDRKVAEMAAGRVSD